MHSALNLGSAVTFRLLIVWSTSLSSGQCVRFIFKSFQFVASACQMERKWNKTNDSVMATIHENMKIDLILIVLHIECNSNSGQCPTWLYYSESAIGSSLSRMITVFLLSLSIPVNNFNKFLLQPRLVDTLMTAEKHSHYQNSVNCFRKLLGKFWQSCFNLCLCRIS